MYIKHSPQSISSSLPYMDLRLLYCAPFSGLRCCFYCTARLFQACAIAFTVLRAFFRLALLLKAKVPKLRLLSWLWLRCWLLGCGCE